MYLQEVWKIEEMIQKMANKVKDSIKLSYDLYNSTQDNPVDKKTYIDINRLFMKYLSGKLLVGGYVKFPERLGYVQVIGSKSKFRVEGNQIKGLAPDWKSTKELWEREPKAREQKRVLFHFNEETNGIRYRFFWSKSGIVIPNKTLYNFRACRTNKRTLSKRVKEGYEYLIK